MSFQKAALSNLGGVEMHKGDFRAHLQFRDDEGKNNNCGGVVMRTACVTIVMARLAAEYEIPTELAARYKPPLGERLPPYTLAKLQAFLGLKDDAIAGPITHAFCFALSFDMCLTCQAGQ